MAKKKKPVIHINPPPSSARCECCLRHISEIKAFGGKGDPVRGDFSGAKLVKNFRAMAYKESDKIWNIKDMWIKGKKLTKKEMKEYKELEDKQRVPEKNYKGEIMKNCYKVNIDLLSEPEKKRFRELQTKHYDSYKHLDEDKFVKKYGEKALKDYYFRDQLENTVEASWECRDCIILYGKEFYKKREEAWKKWQDQKK